MGIIPVSIVFKQILQEVMQKMFSNQSFSKNQSESIGYRTLGSGFGREEMKNESLQLSHTASFRATSPKSGNSKTKIKLVSPFKNKGNNNATLKENDPPAKLSGFAKSPSHLHRNSAEIQLGGKTAQKPAVSGHVKNYSDLSVPQTYERPMQQVLVNPQPVHSSSFKRVVPYTTVEAQSRPLQTRKVVSPSKICINNKSFDIGTIKSKIVYVVPLRNKSETFDHHAHDRKVSRQDVTVNPVCPSELAIQEENSLQDLKDSYESQMKEIKQLQQEIQDNNVQIKELLKASNVSRHISSSRLSNHSGEINQSEENLSLNLIDEKQGSFEVKNVSQPVTSRRQSSQLIQPAKIEQQVRVQLQRDQVSVQTDMPDCAEESSLLEKNQSRHSKFSISKNAECEIQLIGSKEEEYSVPFVQEQDNQYTFANDLQEKKSGLKIESQASISHQVLRESTSKKQEPLQISQKAEVLANQEEIIPVSQRSVQSKGQSKLISNEVEVNLQASRAETEKSIIRSSNIVIENRQSEKIIPPRMGVEAFKSADNIPVPTKPKPIQVSKPSESRSQFQKRSESSILNQPQQKSVPVTPTSTRPNPAPEELKTSAISGASGKRRINNSIYL